MVEKVLIVNGIQTPYTINERGDIRSIRTGKLRKPNINKGKRGVYHRIRLQFDGITIREYIHRLVAFNFLPERSSPGLDINHNDGNTLNNHVSNLYWNTRSENVKHFHTVIKPKRGKKEEVNHKRIYEKGLGVKVKEGNDVHHIDWNNLNDSLVNLIEVTKDEHKWLHRKENVYLQTYSRDEIRKILKHRCPEGVRRTPYRNYKSAANP